MIHYGTFAIQYIIMEFIFTRTVKVSHFQTRQKHYTFEIDKPVEFLNGRLAFLLDLMPDILKLIEILFIQQLSFPSLKS
jgi:hypothetical protein